MPTPALATQLIVFNGHVDFEKDPDTVLAAAAAAGFQAIEGQLEDPARLRARLDAHGLRHAAVHVVPSQLREPQRWIDYLSVTGARDVCSSGLLHWHQRTPADHDDTIEVLNRAGRTLRAQGIHLHYHNHDFELTEQPVPGVTSLEYLVKGLDPEAVDLCVDVAWLHRAKIAPVEFLRREASRIGYLHLKDWNGRAWVPLGEGEVDLAGVLATLPSLPTVRWVVNEQDNTERDPAGCLQRAGAWLQHRPPGRGMTRS